MLLWPDCVPCILRMSLEVGRLVIKDEEQLKEFMSSVLELNPLCGKNWQITAGEVVRDVWYILTEITGKKDPMEKIKKDLNKRVLQVYPSAKELVLRDPDPFTAALKLSIAGNTLDIMTGINTDATKKLILSLEKYPVNSENIKVLRGRLNKTRRLVYFSDNCGEIVFDRLFIEVIQQIYDLEITVVTRRMPVLNDAILHDALSAGLGEITEVIENGIEEPLAGTMLSKVSPYVKSLAEKADLLISKGGANFDCLTEEPSIEGKISYLFHCKCYPYCIENKVPMGTLIVRNN